MSDVLPLSFGLYLMGVSYFAPKSGAHCIHLNSLHLYKIFSFFCAEKSSCIVS